MAYAPTADGHEALRAAASLAVRCEAALAVIAVAAPLPWMGLVEPALDGTTLEAAYRDHIAHELEAAVADLPESLAVEAEMRSGDPVALIAAATEDLDLLVCGSRGHGLAGTVVLGSVPRAARGRALPGARGPAWLRAAARAGARARRPARPLGVTKRARASRAAWRRTRRAARPR